MEQITQIIRLANFSVNFHAGDWARRKNLHQLFSGGTWTYYHKLTVYDAASSMEKGIFFKRRTIKHYSKSDMTIKS